MAPRCALPKRCRRKGFSRRRGLSCVRAAALTRLPRRPRRPRDRRRGHRLLRSRRTCRLRGSRPRPRGRRICHRCRRFGNNDAARSRGLALASKDASFETPSLAFRGAVFLTSQHPESLGVRSKLPKTPRKPPRCSACQNTSCARDSKYFNYWQAFSINKLRNFRNKLDFAMYGACK